MSISHTIDIKQVEVFYFPDENAWFDGEIVDV